MLSFLVQWPMLIALPLGGGTIDISILSFVKDDQNSTEEAKHKLVLSVLDALI